MKAFWTIHIRFNVLLLFLLINVLAGMVYYFQIGGSTTINLLLFLSSLIIMGIGMMKGLLLALGLSLNIIFGLGTLMLLSGLNVYSPFQMTLQDTLFWMVISFTIAVASGSLFRLIQELQHENTYMKQRFEDLVTIDDDTGLSNGKRMWFDLKEEYNRAQRTGGTFSIVLIKIYYFEQLEKLYGYKEKKHILASFSGRVIQHTRQSDRKYRVQDDLFALILPNTPSEDLSVVTNKLESENKTHTLSSGNKTINLTFGFGAYEYDRDMIDEEELYNLAKENLPY